MGISFVETELLEHFDNLLGINGSTSILVKY